MSIVLNDYYGLKGDKIMLAERFNTIRNEIPGHVKLIAVSKTHPAELIREAYDLGQRTFGESKVQELSEKVEALPGDIEWHMIGHLQSNKVKYIAPFVALIHAVDSLKLLLTIDREAKKAARVIPCLIQVHIARESTKFGFTAEEVLAIFTGGELKELRNVEIAGLMGMATFTQDTDQIRREFRALKALFDDIRKKCFPDNEKFKELSMGMSDDYKIAIEEGSTMVRVGSALFGDRDYSK